MKKKPLIFLGLAFLSVILHNLISGIFNFEEALFFILTFVFVFLAAFYGAKEIILLLKGRFKK